MVFPFPSHRSNVVRNRRKVSLNLEHLEDRCVLSAGVNPAVVPVPETNLYGLMRVEQNLYLAQTNPSVVFLGDSILDLYANGAGAYLWNSQIAPMQAADLAIWGNTTQNVLWQIESGELSGMSPKTVVLMVGVNNLIQGETPEQVAAGIKATVAAIEAVQPQAQVLVLGILPARGPEDPLRGEISQTNSLIANLANGSNVHFSDLGSSLIRPDGTIAPGMVSDGVHPTALGYAVLTTLLQPELQAMLASTSSAGGFQGTSTAETYSTPRPPAPQSTITLASDEGLLTVTQLAIAAGQTGVTGLSSTPPVGNTGVTNQNSITAPAGNLATDPPQSAQQTTDVGNTLESSLLDS